MSKLAINGGTPVRSTPFPRYNTIGEEEKRAVMAVLDSLAAAQKPHTFAFPPHSASRWCMIT